MSMLRLLRCILPVAIILISGCATVDFDYPREASTAPPAADTADTALGRSVAELSVGRQEGQSGFYALSDAMDALTARIVLMRRAERTIDAQYYLIKSDPAGQVFVSELLHAADRGVRVRLLIDDMFTSGLDLGWAAVDHHPNVEVRVFNPFASRSARFRDGIFDFSRINRRMHNKSFTADNQVTIIGGRNIAGEYFGARRDSQFADLDVMAIGPVVDEVSDSFDLYWSHERAMPLPAFAKMPEDLDAALATVRRQLDQSIEEIYAEEDYRLYGDALRAKVMASLDAGGDTDALTWAPYVLTVDSPDKTYKKRAETAESIMTGLSDSLSGAQNEILLISPYFVPLKSGIEALARLEERGVEVTVVTNSLAANNQFTVHGGYAPARKPLLRAGVEIYEVRRDVSFEGQEFIAASGAKATLHTKAFVVDRRELFIGSFNFDPRSAYINTELGVIIRSPEMAAALDDAIEAAFSTYAWQVKLDDEGRLRWHGTGADGQPVVYTKEPQTSWWQRFVAGFVRLLPIRSQL
ncbi:MAG: phospholipase D family protein [Gammaproteobacteria bacterium]|jgi:putative cardiolipin synthase